VVFFHIHNWMLEKTGLLPQSKIEIFIHHILLKGFFGVHLFFFISGYCIARPWFNRGAYHPKMLWKTYFFKRFFRIFPAYFLSSVVIGAALIVFKIFPITNVSNTFLLSLIFCTNYFSNGGTNLILPAAWSLEVEVQFYLFFPLFLLAISNFKTRHYQNIFLLGLLILGLAFSKFGNDLPTNLFQFLGYFTVGIFTAVYQDYLTVIKKGWEFDLVALLTLTCALFLKKPWLENLGPFLMVPIFVSAFKSIWFNALLNSKLIYQVGGMCYSLYLTHLFIIVCVGKFIPLNLSANYLVQLTVCCAIFLPLILIGAFILFVFVEKPTMNWNWAKS